MVGRLRWWPAAGCALVSVVLTVLVAAGWASLQSLDRRIVDAAHRQVLAHEGLLTTSRVVSHLGDPLVVTVVTLVLVAVLWLRGSRRAVVALVVVRVVAMLTSTGLKHLVDRPRPVLTEAVAHASSAAFPSGHALGSAALWGSVAFLAYDRFGRWVAVAVAVLVPLFVAVSRVLLGVHWPSDVVGGLFLGWTVALVCVAAVARSATFA